MNTEARRLDVYRGVADHIGSAEFEAIPDHRHDLRATAHIHEALVLSGSLEFEGAISSSRIARHEAHFAGDLMLVVMSYLSEIDAQISVGDFDSALSALDEAANVTSPLDDSCSVRTHLALFRGVCREEQGNSASAVVELREAVAGYELLESVSNLSQATRMLGQSLLKVGQRAEARAMYVRSLELSMQYGVSMTTLENLTIIATYWPAAPDPTLQLQILQTIEEQRPTFLDRQSGDLRRRMGEVRARLGSEVSTAVRNAPLPSPELIVEATLARLREHDTVSQKQSGHGLSPREVAVLRRVAMGDSDKEVAATLHIGLRTVHSHVASILRKLGVNSRRLAAAWARTNAALLDEGNR